MLRNYFKITLRNLIRHKSYSAINISGLAIGIASFILICLFIKDELSYIFKFIISFVTISFQSIKAATVNPVDSLKYE